MRPLCFADRQPIDCSQAEIHRLRNPVFSCQTLESFHGIVASAQPLHPFAIAADVPAAPRRIELMGAWADATVRNALPVCRVVAGSMPRFSEIRDLVVFESAAGEHLVGDEEFGFVRFL